MSERHNEAGHKGLAALERGCQLHRAGDIPAAAESFELGFVLAPSLINAYRDRAAQPDLQRRCLLAHSTIREHHLHRYQAALQPLAAQHGVDALSRVKQFVRVFHGIAPPEPAHPLQRPTYQWFPGLKAQPWWSATDWDSLRSLTESAEAIARELASCLTTSASLTRPYVPSSHEEPGWEPLQGSQAWSSLHLIKAGRRTDAATLFPSTLAICDALPVPQLAEQSPELFFSTLRPGTKIPPHHGLSNMKLTVHLPLQVNDRCQLRVGTEARAWQRAVPVVFDDSFLHEAWNLGEQDRTVLIAEIWHPDITAVERVGISRVMASYESWQRQVRQLAEART